MGEGLLTREGFVLVPSIKGETWYVGSKRRRGPLTEEALREAMKGGATIRVGPKAQKRLQTILQGMDGTMTPPERRRILERRRGRKGDSRAKARIADPSPF